MENPTIVYCDPKYMKDCVYTVTKTGDVYTLHSEGENLVEFDNKVSVSIFLDLLIWNHDTKFNETNRLH